MKAKTQVYQPPSYESTPDDDLEAVAEWRGLNIETLTTAGVYVDWDHVIHPNFGPGSHPILFPYPNMQGVWYKRGRRWMDNNEKPKYLGPKGGKQHLYNPNLLGPAVPYLWICEGEIDTLTMLELGRNAVGIQGTHTFDKRWAELWQYTNIILALDPDDEAQKQSGKIAACFPPENVYHFELPNREDLNGIHQAEALLDMVTLFEEKWQLEGPAT